jgi:hypothetical protein
VKDRADKFEGMWKTGKEGRIRWQEIALGLQQQKVDNLVAVRKEKNKNNKPSAKVPKAKNAVQSGGVIKVINKKPAHHARRKHETEVTGFLYTLPTREKPVQQAAQAEDALNVSGA